MIRFAQSLCVLLTLILAFVSSADTQPPQFLPADLDLLDQNQKVAVGSKGWLYLRVPARYATPMIGRDDPEVYLYDVATGQAEQKVACEPVGAALFQDTRSIRCLIPHIEKIQSASHHAIVAGTSPLWAGTIYTDFRPPVLAVTAEALPSCLMLKISYSDPDSQLPSQRYFPIPAEKEPVPRLQVFVGSSPVARWYSAAETDPEQTRTCIVNWKGWRGKEIVVEARDYAGNLTRVVTGIRLP